MAGDRRHGARRPTWRRQSVLHLVPNDADDTGEDRHFETTDAKAVLTAYVDDYAEVWINGQMPRRSGYPSPATIQGLNMPNRVVLADAVKPGDKFQIAIFGINGPISVAPENFVWFHAAKVEFFR
jgi:gluconolactonase